MDSLTISEQTALILSIENSRKSLSKLSVIEGKYRSKMKGLIKHRSETLIELVEQNYFIHDDSLEQLISSIKDEIVNNNNQESFPERLLISRNPTVNAACWGEGTIVINIGLIASVNSSDELAFAVAHEMAHQLLDHVNSGQLERLKMISNTRSLKEQLKRGGKLEVIKNTAYTLSKYSRKKETEADILAIKLLQNTIYDWRHYNILLNVLDSSDFPLIRKPPALKSFFDFDKYSFKNSWLVKPQSAFTKTDESGDHLFDKDSLKLHPDIPKRKSTLDSLFTVSEEMKFKSPFYFSADLKYRTNLELVQSTYELEAFALSLFLALQRLELYPENQYLKSQIARILINLYIARKEHNFGKFVSMSNNYPKAMEEVHIFLNNIRLSEIGNIAYQYLNQVNIFDQSNEEHYYLLWKISNEIGKQKTKESIVKSYSKSFPNGKYSTIFKLN